MLCDVIQYMLPDGRKSPQQVELDDALAASYERMRKSGYRLAAEVLTTGHVSVTIESDQDDLDLRVVPNGPRVRDAYENMLRAHFGEAAQ
jgi:Arc/MetJ family transcription regulator